MKKELQYFTIEGAYGGNQDWFTNVVMRIGGCGAATACDSCIYYAEQRGWKELYPFDCEHLSKEDYKNFSQKMKQYIKPRVGGVRKLQWYMDGLQQYIRETNHDKGCDFHLEMEGVSGNCPYEEVKEIIKYQIDQKSPVPYLLLKHMNPRFKDFVWHWFLVTGYEEVGEQFLINTATYGQSRQMPLKELWNTGYAEKGGIIKYSTAI